MNTLITWISLRSCLEWNKFFYNNPELFHARYFWKNEIKFKVINPELNSDWINNIKTNPSNVVADNIDANDIRSTGLKLLRKFKKSMKKRKVNLTDILACPECHNCLVEDDSHFICNACRLKYSKIPLPDFNKGEKF